MRADRLVAIVLLLQAHGSLTAGELAERLETSERTIRRDLDALLMAGVPLYVRRGRGGGWQLLGGHRIDLSGLTAAEAQALFLAAAGAPGWLGPGVHAALDAARRKVLAALPEPLRQRVSAAGTAVLVDTTRWGPAGPEGAPQDEATGPRDTRTRERGAHLDALRGAVLDGRQVVVRYEPPGRPPEDRTLHPYGLVAKRGVWYLVARAQAGMRTYRLTRVRSVTVTDEPAERPADFDLARAWADVVAGVGRRVTPEVATDVVATAAGARRLAASVGAWWPVREVGTDADGRVRLSVRFPTAGVAAAELAPLGEDVTVIGPPGVRDALAAVGRRLLARYG